MDYSPMNYPTLPEMRKKMGYEYQTSKLLKTNHMKLFFYQTAHVNINNEFAEYVFVDSEKQKSGTNLISKVL
jgi:hypothetical protein